MNLQEITANIKQEALRMGFSAIGIAKVSQPKDEMEHLKRWISLGNHADMEYMERNMHLRNDPKLLVPNAKSIISLAINYYPPKKQDKESPQIAYYAYGKDYHKVLKKRLETLWQSIQNMHPQALEAEHRCFTDSAPILERHWAWKAGIGYRGKNTNLIIPNKGSYFFLAEIISTLDFAYDTPIPDSCGRCTLCIKACPMSAITQESGVDARKCLSYLTIEHRGELPNNAKQNIGNRLFGCDTCQQACPQNAHATPTPEEEDFKAEEAILHLRKEQLQNFSKEEYLRIFSKSAVKRAKYDGLKRNAQAFLEAQEKDLQSDWNDVDPLL